MKPKFYPLLLGAFCFLVASSAHAFTTLTIVQPVTATNTDPDPLASISAKQFLTLTPKKYHEITGKKMNIVQRMELKFLQYKIKRMMKKGKEINMADVIKRAEDDSLMNVLAFLLGAILGPIGVIIVLILKQSGDMSQTAFRWSLIGLVLWLLWFFVWVIF